MESYNLKTASSYVNNLLLARGLLRHGTPIEFAQPSRGQGGKETTMAQIINLVHDLILKRDRDQEHREAVASTIRTLRSDATRQAIAMEKLQTRNDDLARQVSLAQSQERSARAALRTAESSARSLREEMLRLKTTVQQVRTSCANDIRKRDVQIQRLKSHLTSQQRGNKTGLIGASITINPGATNFNGGASSTGEEVQNDHDHDPEYSLRQETNEVLTHISQQLSEENDNLMALVRTTLVTLKELQGMPEDHRLHDGEGLFTTGDEDENTRQAMLSALPDNYEALATNMDAVLDNLKNLLTNPNFVSVDEVELREEEIVKLRAGWERMETRWRDTLSMMDGWRKRMVNGDTTINLEELKVTLGLGPGLETMGTENVPVITEDEENEDASSVFDDEIDETDKAENLPWPEADEKMPEKTASAHMFKSKLQPLQPALREATGNMNTPNKSPRKVAFSASIPNTPSQMEDENAEDLDMGSASVSKPARPSSGTKPGAPTEEAPRSSRPDGRSSSQTKKRASSPHAHEEELLPKLTVQDKLKKAQAEAEAAAVVEGLQAAESEGVRNGGDVVEQKQRRRHGSPVKTRIGGRPRRRKSTLTPEELENLLRFD
ncbi:hypothetical protein K504DRAFT_504397 [Pleomassaria siparia CBS 279.74]|uniref:NIMA interactive protein n=1 Tax=Pleomassaria siparia CBS 279.74 TaxID=1314801 RepID=A0A6G1K3W6_9PLEO|nr:hypothetical protein K504DRAFT_504397 [Pleomassaria siparia CBS 279.74]